MPAKPSTQPIAVAALRVSVPEAARLIGLSRAETYKRIKNGQLRPVKEGSRTLFTITELQRYVTATDPAAPREGAQSDAPVP